MEIAYFKPADTHLIGKKFVEVAECVLITAANCMREYPRQWRLILGEGYCKVFIEKDQNEIRGDKKPSNGTAYVRKKQKAPESKRLLETLIPTGRRANCHTKKAMRVNLKNPLNSSAWKPFIVNHETVLEEVSYKKQTFLGLRSHGVFYGRTLESWLNLVRYSKHAGQIKIDHKYFQSVTLIPDLQAA